MDALKADGPWGLLAIALVAMFFVWRRHNKKIDEAQKRVEKVEEESRQERDKHYAWAVEQVAKASARDAQIADALELQAKNTYGILEILLKGGQ